jgi:hypothetical protein
MAAESDHLYAGFVGRPVGAGIIHDATEIFRIHARAWAAAQEYEALKRLSDADLAERGLKRVDLPRAAFHLLTGQALVPTRATDQRPGGHDVIR